tara:strand:- start:1367 stop:1660 length:294 start_codon:yes stop_codon:yes gene_type:complete
MYNLKANFDKISPIIKSSLNELLLSDDKFQYYRNPHKWSDIETITLAILAEIISLDSESWLFTKMKSDLNLISPVLIDHSNYNHRKRRLNPYIDAIS